MRKRFWLLGVLTIGIILAAIFVTPIPQQLSYHQFADQRIFWGIPNFWNVASNLILLLTGLMGLVFVFLQFLRFSPHRSFDKTAECWPYLIVFLSVVMTGFGSAYYHWAPDNERLLWDRLPIAIGITALLAATLMERISLKLGLYLLPVLIVLGMTSVLYWYWSEQLGLGNLNFYIVTQFYSLLLIILLGIFFPSRYTRETDIFWVIALYGVAKFAEILDQEIYNLGQIISGHTVKHLLAALAVYGILRMLKNRVHLS